MTDPLAKWQATDLRDEMIEVISSIVWGAIWQDESPDPGEIADAIVELLARSDAGSLPDEGKE